MDVDWYRLSDIEALRLTATRFNEVADVLEEMMERNDDEELPFRIYIPEYYSEFSTNLTVQHWDQEAGEYVTDKEKSLAAIAEVAALLPGRKEKVLDDDGLTVKFTTYSGAPMEFTTNKEVTCTKKVVGKKWVEPYTPEPREGHYEDIVEWECDEVVLLHHKAK